MIVALVVPPLLAGAWFMFGPPSDSFSSPVFSTAIVLAIAAAVVFVSARIALRGEF